MLVPVDFDVVASHAAGVHSDGMVFTSALATHWYIDSDGRGFVGLDQGSMTFIIKALFVHPTERGLGFGERLLTDVIDMAGNIDIEVIAESHLHRWFCRHGFIATRKMKKGRMAHAATDGICIMTRFNSPELLATWKRTKRFPAIHDAMAAAATSYLRGTRLMDLGCSYGLLGARIAKDIGHDTAIGVEADKSVIEAGEKAGVPMVYHHMRVTAETLDQLVSVVRCHGVNVIIARRIMPELFGSDIDLGKRFAAEMAKAGVREMLIEGRVVSERSTNALASIDAEVEMLIGEGFYREARRIKAISYLTARA